jgi:UDP-glucose 4-epimerase
MRSRKPSCVVLGGGGFLGLNLCRYLESKGYRVRAFGRRCLFPEALGDVPWFAGDAADPGALAAAIESSEVAVHLIGTTTKYSSMDSSWHDDVGNALRCFDVGHKLGVKRIVFASSGGAIYGAPTQMPIPETAPTEPFAPYGISKLAIEKYLAVYRRFHGIDYRILRIANVFGPFQVPKSDHGVIATFVSRALRDQALEIWGDGSIVRDYIFVDDVCAAIEFAINDDSDQRVFNIGSGQGRTLTDIVGSIERLLDRKLKIDRIEGRIGDVPASVLATDKASAVLGWNSSTPFEVGLRRTFDWWESTNGQHKPAAAAYSDDG